MRFLSNFQGWQENELLFVTLENFRDMPVDRDVQADEVSGDFC